MQQTRNLTNAVLLINLGTPDAPTPRAVKRFLSEFLHDHRVIKLTRWLWCPLLHGVILPLRGKRLTKLYQSIWMPGGSPIKVYTAAQAKALQARLGEGVRVYYAMRYASPSIASVLKTIVEEGADSLVILPLYPQFSHTTTSSVLDAIQQAEKSLKLPPKTVLPAYYDHPLYIKALCNSIREHWAESGRGERLLFSFHGLPQAYVDQGDPYPRHCEATVEAVVRELGLALGDYQIAYQSRFGPTLWVGPYTDKTLLDWAAQGVKHVDIISPAFAADCLETLEELEITNAEAFLEAGGERIHYIAALNDRPDHIEMMAAITTP
jgi:ferrochelatase